MPGWSLLAVVLPIANVIFLVAIFRWKSWDVYGLCTSVLLAATFNLSAGASLLATLTELPLPVLLLVLLLPR